MLHERSAACKAAAARQVIYACSTSPPAGTSTFGLPLPVQHSFRLPRQAPTGYPAHAHTNTHTKIHKHVHTHTHTHGYACAQEGMRLRMSTRWCTLAGHALLSAPTVVVSMKTGSEMLRMPGMASTQACTVLQGALGEDASVLASSSFAALVFSFSSAACTPTRTAPHAPACLAKRTCGCADPVALVLY